MKYVICLCLALLVSSRVCAETYSWVDDLGVWNLSDDFSRVPKKYRKSAVRGDAADSTSVPEKPAIIEKLETPAVKGSVADNSSSQLYGGKAYSDWRKEFDLHESELKRIEVRLEQIQASLKKLSNTSRASYNELLGEYNALRSQYKEKYRAYSDMMEAARKAGLKVDIK